MAVNNTNEFAQPFVSVLQEPQGHIADTNDDPGRTSLDSASSVSTTSLVFERINERLASDKMRNNNQRNSFRPRVRPHEDRERLSEFSNEDLLKDELDENDFETGPFLGRGTVDDRPINAPKNMDRGLRRTLLAVCVVMVACWMVAFLIHGVKKASRIPSQSGSGKPITLEQVQNSFWEPARYGIAWIAGADGEDGMLLEQGAADKAFLVVEDVRSKNPQPVSPTETIQDARTLMRNGSFEYNGKTYAADGAVPSRNLQSVLVSTNTQSQWRHSALSSYWIFDVTSQSAKPLVPGEPDARIQLAQWNPTSDAIVFVRDRNLYLRRLGHDEVIQITKDGGPDVFNGVPDWVYEEEVLAGAVATWWSADGNFLAFLRTNESGVPDYNIDYFVSRPSGKKPAPGEESYPEHRQIKYPKAGAHNPIVEVKFYDVVRGDVFQPRVEGGFADEDRLVTTVVWAGKQAIVKETNRVSTILRVVLIDVMARTGKAVRTADVKNTDGGWFEISQNTQYVPADPAKGRPLDGYVDTVIHDNGDHLAYFTPMDNPEPTMLTSGNWEVDKAPSAIDLSRNLVYFVATKESSVQRHVYQVKLTGEDLTPITDTSREGYYSISFSSGTGFALLSYEGPEIPWQMVISTPSNPVKYKHIIAENEELAKKAGEYELPIKLYGTVNVDGVELNYVERRPPHFDEKKTYPVLFHQYSGPGSQQVTKQFVVDFQSYVAAGLGYICVTVDGRGTGFIGRKNRVLVRGNLGHWEAHDQIAAATNWTSRSYVDAERLAIWGWSYGGFMTLKTLERDAGQTFRYGMAVAPVTDWRFYDSVYAERYMSTPQDNEAGYEAAAVNNASALGQNQRFLLMHGAADDNVHFQNSLTLLDKLDRASVENYDVHVFPDSDHNISFGNAHRIVYDKLVNWLVNAFNGEWLKVANAKPNQSTS